MILDTTRQDILYSLRTLRNNPAFALTAVLMLALGIGGNTAIFTVIRSVLLKPLQYRDPDRLVRLSVDEEWIHAKDVGFNQIRYEELRAAAQSFTEIGAFFLAHEQMTLSTNGDPESIKVARVSENFLRILGVEPVLGRSFLPEEDPATFVGIAVVFIAVAFAASYIPAWRATRIDPMAAVHAG